MASCGYIGFLLIGSVVALISGLIGSLVGLMTRPMAGAIVSVVVNAILIGLFFRVVLQMTPPSPPEVPDMKADTVQSLVWLCGFLFAGGSVVSVSLSYGIAKRKRSLK